MSNQQTDQIREYLSNDISPVELAYLLDDSIYWITELGLMPEHRDEKMFNSITQLRKIRNLLIHNPDS